MPTPREVIESFYDKLARNDIPGLWALYAPDLTYTVTGTTPLSGTFRGLDEIREKLFVPVFSKVKELVLTPDRLIVDGGTVVALVRGQGKTADGKPYANRYAFVFEVRDGKITEVTEFLDTALVETTLYGRTIA